MNSPEPHLRRVQTSLSIVPLQFREKGGVLDPIISNKKSLHRYKASTVVSGYLELSGETRKSSR